MGRHKKYVEYVVGSPHQTVPKENLEKSHLLVIQGNNNIEESAKSALKKLYESGYKLTNVCSHQGSLYMFFDLCL